MPLTEDEFACGMAPVLAVWHKEQPPPAALEAYYRVLAHIPVDMIEAAAWLVLNDKQYGFPKPDAFIDAAERIIMFRQDFSREWARQWLDEKRAEYLALESGLKRLESP